MPYSSRSDLPDSVKDNLPPQAQDIYKEAFNSALKQYSSEKTAHQVAWSAVKKQFHKDNSGNWTKDKD